MISDGLSKTLMFGECPGSIGTGIALPYGTFSGLVVGHGWAGDTTLATVSGLFSSRGTQESDAFKFSSLHSGNIVLFATCDGGVKALPKSIDLSVLDALASIRGSETIDDAQVP